MHVYIKIKNNCVLHHILHTVIVHGLDRKTVIYSRLNHLLTPQLLFMLWSQDDQILCFLLIV